MVRVLSPDHYRFYRFLPAPEGTASPIAMACLRFYCPESFPHQPCSYLVECRKLRPAFYGTILCFAVHSLCRLHQFYFKEKTHHKIFYGSCCLCAFISQPFPNLAIRSLDPPG